MRFNISLTSSDDTIKIFSFSFEMQLVRYIKTVLLGIKEKRQEERLDLEDPLLTHEIGFGGGV